MFRSHVAQVGDDVKIVDIEWHLKVPSDLRTTEDHVSTHSKCILALASINNDQKRQLRKIIIVKDATFGNNSLINGNVRVSSDTIVGNMMRLKPSHMNEFTDDNVIFLALPQKMPFEEHHHHYQYFQRH